MAFKKNTTGALIEVDPAEAKRLIVEAFTKARANQAGAARALGCAENTFIRWIAKLKLRKELNAIKKQAMKQGWFHEQSRKGGRPPKQRHTRASAA